MAFLALSLPLINSGHIDDIDDIDDIGDADGFWWLSISIMGKRLSDPWRAIQGKKAATSVAHNDSNLFSSL